MILASLLSSSSFIMTNKILIKAVGLDAAVLIGELCSEYNYWEDRQELLYDEWFYSTRENIEKNTGLSEHRQRMAINLLIGLKLLELKKMGIPCKTYYRLNEENILNYYNQTQEKLLKPYKNSVVENFDDKKLKNGISSSLEIEEQEIKNFDGKKLNNGISSNANFEGQAMQNFNINKNNNKNNKNQSQYSASVEIKKQFATYVSMTEKEYNDLIQTYGIEKTQKMINELNLYKQSTGKTYENDYAAILRWVVKKFDEKQNQRQYNSKYAKSEISVYDLAFNQSQCSDEELAKKYEDLYDN